LAGAPQDTAFEQAAIRRNRDFQGDGTVNVQLASLFRVVEVADPFDAQPPVGLVARPLVAVGTVAVAVLRPDSRLLSFIVTSPRTALSWPTWASRLPAFTGVAGVSVDSAEGEGSAGDFLLLPGVWYGPAVAVVCCR
jgi:hypothetical protein